MPEAWKLRLSYTLFESGDAHCVLPVVCCLFWTWANFNLHLFSNIQYQTLNDYFCSISAVLILVTEFLLNSSVSSFFPIQHSMLDVRCSMFIFFQYAFHSPPAQNQLSAYDPASPLHSLPASRLLAYATIQINGNINRTNKP